MMSNQEDEIDDGGDNEEDNGEEMEEDMEDEMHDGEMGYGEEDEDLEADNEVQ